MIGRIQAESRTTFEPAGAVIGNRDARAIQRPKSWAPRHRNHRDPGACGALGARPGVVVLVLDPFRRIRNRPRPLHASRATTVRWTSTFCSQTVEAGTAASADAHVRTHLRQARAAVRAGPRLAGRRARQRRAGNQGADATGVSAGRVRRAVRANGCADGRDRRRVRQPQRPRPTSRRYRRCVRPAALHHRERLLPKVDQNGGTAYPAGERGLGHGDLPRPADGERGLPELQHPAGRGHHQLVRQPRHRGEPGGGDGRGRGEQQLRRRRVLRRDHGRRHLLQPPGCRDHRQLG